MAFSVNYHHSEGRMENEIRQRNAQWLHTVLITGKKEQGKMSQSRSTNRRKNTNRYFTK